MVIDTEILKDSVDVWATARIAEVDVLMENYLELSKSGSPTGLPPYARKAYEELEESKNTITTTKQYMITQIEDVEQISESV